MPCIDTAHEHRHEQNLHRLTYNDTKPALYRQSHSYTFTNKGTEKQRSMQTEVIHTESAIEILLKHTVRHRHTEEDIIMHNQSYPVCFLLGYSNHQ